MPLPEKSYERLHTLWKRWDLPQEDIYYAVESGLLQTCVWMPLRVMELGVIRGSKFVYEKYEHKGGFLGIRQEDFYRITSTGRARLRIFHSIEQRGKILRLAYEPPQPTLSVCIHDLVVLKNEIENFEAAHNLIASHHKKQATEEFIASQDYHHVILNGEEHHFGDVQANIIHQLHDASTSQNKWVHGKTLLYGANSKAVRLRDVFKSKHDWGRLIVSNGRGYYRLNISSESREHITHSEAA
jgi:hypothetical protein